MNHLEIKDEILRLLEEIVNRTHQINQHHPQKDLSLEIDLVRDDLRMLYRSFETLSGLSDSPADNKTGKRIHGQEPAEKAENTQALNEGPPDEVVSPQPEKPEADNAASGQSSPPEPSSAKTPESAPPGPKKGSGENNGNKAVIDILSEYSNRTVGDQYLKEEDDSLHQRISGHKEDKSIGTRMQQHPITSLKDVIGVNEKFLFINELFNGNIQDYHEAIAKLNEMKDIKAAFDYLNTLGMEYSWDANRSAGTIEKLANFVQRRHMRV